MKVNYSLRYSTMGSHYNFESDYEGIEGEQEKENALKFSEENRDFWINTDLQAVGFIQKRVDNELASGVFVFFKEGDYTIGFLRNFRLSDEWVLSSKEEYLYYLNGVYSEIKEAFK
jgi:hypothetical protein